MQGFELRIYNYIIVHKFRSRLYHIPILVTRRREKKYQINVQYSKQRVFFNVTRNTPIDHPDHPDHFLEKKNPFGEPLRNLSRKPFERNSFREVRRAPRWSRSSERRRTRIRSRRLSFALSFALPVERERARFGAIGQFRVFWTRWRFPRDSVSTELQNRINVCESHAWRSRTRSSIESGRVTQQLSVAVTVTVTVTGHWRCSSRSNSFSLIPWLYRTLEVIGNTIKAPARKKGSTERKIKVEINILHGILASIVVNDERHFRIRLRRNASSHKQCHIGW